MEIPRLVRYQKSCHDLKVFHSLINTYGPVSNFMSMKNAFIYPHSGRIKDFNNPYIQDFMDGLTDKVLFVNRTTPSNIGLFNIIPFLLKIDVVFLNWIEDLPEKKYGILQSGFLFFLLPFLKITGVRIFYTVHNKKSHRPDYHFIKQFIRKFCYIFADYLLVHSSEGLRLLNRPWLLKKTRYEPHPFQDSSKETQYIKKQWDILIWGSVQPYKGIDLFLEFVKLNPQYFEKTKILVAGKVNPPAYYDKLMNYQTSFIVIRDNFLDETTLNEYIATSRIVLFTYNDASVLSSGALVHSISQQALIVGPNIAAFKDMKEKGIIEVYDHFEEISDKINIIKNNEADYKKRMLEFVSKNTWQIFGTKIYNWIYPI